MRSTGVLISNTHTHTHTYIYMYGSDLCCAGMIQHPRCISLPALPCVIRRCTLYVLIRPRTCIICRIAYRVMCILPYGTIPYSALPRALLSGRGILARRQKKRRRAPGTKAGPRQPLGWRPPPIPRLALLALCGFCARRVPLRGLPMGGPRPHPQIFSAQKQIPPGGIGRKSQFLNPPANGPTENSLVGYGAENKNMWFRFQLFTCGCGKV